ncbi:hypothetical protein FRC07_003134, partial [Ceratobasidium sp. 392]
TQSPYNLVYVFVTEGNEGGGWSFSESQASEAQFIHQSLYLYDDIAKKALSARIFGISCGINLLATGVIKEIGTALEQTPWQSLVLPATPSLYPEEYACVLPQMFVQMYYIGSSLHSALVRVWATSKRARLHTDLLIFDNRKQNLGVLVEKYTYGSKASRPWGVDLPTPDSLCACANDEKADVKWNRQEGVSFAHGEYFRAINVLSAAGVQVVKEAFDYKRNEFPLDMEDCVHMEFHKVKDEVKKQTHTFPDHDTPWTTRGKALGMWPVV